MPAGSGDVSKVGTPLNNQMAVWTGDGTLEGTSDFTYDGTSLNLATAKNFQIAGVTISSDSSGTTTLAGIDAIDATTESTIEAALDTLSNVTTVGALDSGSITSGFGAINVGNDNISTTGTVSANFFDRTTAGALSFGVTTATSIALGNSATTAISFTTDGTGTTEIVLPADSIGPTEIDDGGTTLDGGEDEFCATYENSTGRFEWQSCGGVPTTITVADETGDASSFIGFFTAATGDLGPKTNAGLTFDATTATLAATVINTPTLTLTGTGTLNGVDVIDATTESNIETALDTLSNVTTVGALNAGSITSGFGSIDLGNDTLQLQEQYLPIHLH